MAKCVLEIRDEVNVKFVGLDVKTRRAISDEAKYFLPYAYHMPAYKLGRWDGCVRYCDIGGRTYMNILDKLLPIVQKAGYEIEIDDKRQPYNFNFPTINLCIICVFTLCFDDFIKFVNIFRSIVIVSF